MALVVEPVFMKASSQVMYPVLALSLETSIACSFSVPTITGNSTSPDSSLSFPTPLLVTLFSNVLAIRSPYHWFDLDHDGFAAREPKSTGSETSTQRPASGAIYGVF